MALARALINEPSLLLADEPTGNLDTRTSHEIMETLTRLNREQGVTIIVVTHEADIGAYADRVLTMRDGKIITDERTRKSATVAATPLLQPAHDPAQPVSQFGAIWAFALMVMAAALQAINRNKMRSSLTMLGVFIGVAALIAMVAVGQGANEAVRKQIERLGTNLVVVLPGARTMGGMRGGSGSASTLTVSDARAIRREAAAVGSVGYLIRQSGQVQYSGQNWTTGIQGVSSNYPPMTNWRIAAGRGIHWTMRTRRRWWSCSGKRSRASCSAPIRIRSARSCRSRACRCGSSVHWCQRGKRPSAPIKTTLS